MNIVILDGKSTNPGDLSWAPLSSLGTVTVYDTSAPEEIVHRAKDADAVILCAVPMTAEIFRALPKLTFIGTLATGYNTIDLAAAKHHGVTVCNVPFYCVETVAQHCFALLLALCNHVAQLDGLLHRNSWNGAKNSSYRDYPLLELSGKKLGILGYGNIGAAVAKIGGAMGMEILAFSRSKKELPGNYRAATLDELLAESDVLSLHCPLTAETRGLLGYENLAKMKPGALLINTARGGILEEAAVAQALENGQLAGAALDVLSQEPPQNSPLLTAKNCLITPHVSWSSREARGRLIQAVADNLSAFLNGSPQNQVFA